MTTFNKRLLPIGLLAACLAIASACGRQKAHSLKEAQIPAGFTFRTSHSVDVTVAAGKTAVPVGGAPIEITRPDGKLVFRGRITADRPLHLKVPLALKDKELTATLRLAGGVTTMKLPISGAAASASFN